MQHPSLSQVWHYQTDSEQQFLLDLHEEFNEHQDEMDAIRDEQRRVLARAYMRRARGLLSTSAECFEPEVTVLPG